VARRPLHRLAAQDGFGLIEVLVTAVLVVILATGVLSALDAASHASGRTKARDVASTLAQSDQERMRSTPLAELSNLDDKQPHRSCDEDGGTCVTYEVHSRAYWVSDRSGTQTCSGSTTDVSYLKLVSTVTWPDLGGRKPVVSESMLAPSSSSLAADQGSLAVRLVRADGTTPLAGATVSLAGPRSHSAVTNENGCVLWGYLPAGNGYTVSFDEPGHVDVNGVQEVSNPVGITAQSTTLKTYLYDVAASAELSFTSRLGTQTYTGQVASAATLGQNQMSPFLRTFAATGGAPAATITAGSLFPFRSGSPGGRYRAYGGGCAANDPNSQAPAQASSYLPDLAPGQVDAPATVALPPLDTRIRVNGAAPVAGDEARLRVVPTTTGCANPAWTAVAPLPAITSGTNAGRAQLPTSSGPAIGFPYGTYRVCAQAKVGGQTKRQDVVVTLNTAAGAKAPPTGASAGVFNFTSATPNGTCDAAS
jgi:prepilin-type N-terminal cleavage/methylation domain-containing protein